jgi:hypothetical protein
VLLKGAEYEKTRLATQLRGARERVGEAKGKCEVRKFYAERVQELVLGGEALALALPEGLSQIVP